MSTPDDDEVEIADQEAAVGDDQQVEEAGAEPEAAPVLRQVANAFVGVEPEGEVGRQTATSEVAEHTGGTDVDDGEEAPEPGETGSVSVGTAALKPAWENIRADYERYLKRIGRKPAGLSRYVRGATSFIDWAASRGYAPDQAADDWKKEFTAYIESLGGAPINKNVDRLAGLGMIDMALNPAEEQYEDPEDEQSEGEEQEEEAAPAPRKKQQPQQQVVFVTQQKQPRSPKAPGPAPRNVMGKLLNTEKVRVYKRNFGKQIYIGEYEVTDIGNNLHKFLKEYVDIEYHDPSGRTTYEVFAVDSRNDADRGPGRQVVIESPPDALPDDELSKARGAVELIRDLRDLDGDKQAAKDALLGEAQKKAAASGDMTQLMMLMMMQNMQQPRNEVDIAGRVLEHMRTSGKAHEVFPMMPPPPLAPMPIAPMVSEEDKAIKTVTAKVLERSLEPRPERNTLDFAKELLAIKELFAPAPNAGDPEMRLLLKTAIEKMSQPQQSGLDAIVSQFGKIKEVVTTLAPQVNAGGLIGTLQSILTPQLGSALGNVIAAGLEKSKAFAAPPQPTPQNGVPPKAPQQPVGPSPQVTAAATAFRNAGDEPGQVVTAFQLFSALYDDAAYKAKMEPALQALLAGDVEPARKTAMELVREVRPDLAKQPFCDRVVAHLIRSAGGTPPEWLEKPVAVAPEPPAAQPTVPVAAVEDPRQGAQLAKEPEPAVVAPTGPKDGQKLRDEEQPKIVEAAVEKPAAAVAAVA